MATNKEVLALLIDAEAHDDLTVHQDLVCVLRYRLQQDVTWVKAFPKASQALLVESDEDMVVMLRDDEGHVLDVRTVPLPNDET